MCSMWIRAENPQGVWIENHVTPPVGYVFSEVFGRQFPRGSLFRNELIALKKLREIGFYDSQCTIYEDWELRIRFAKKFSVLYSGDLLVEYRLHDEGISRSPSWLHLDITKKIYRKNRYLLKDLEISKRERINRNLHQRIGLLAWRAVRQALSDKRYNLVFWYWLQAVWWDPTAILKKFSYKRNWFRRAAPC